MRTCIPEKAYDPIVSDDWSSITYYVSGDSNNDKTKTIELPKWLSEIIRAKVTYAARDAANQVRAEIRNALQPR